MLGLPIDLHYRCVLVAFFSFYAHNIGLLLCTLRLKLYMFKSVCWKQELQYTFAHFSTIW